MGNTKRNDKYQPAKTGSEVGERDGGCPGRLDRAGDFCDKFVTDLAVFVAHREPVEHPLIGGMGSVDIFGHAAPRQFDSDQELV